MKLYGAAVVALTILSSDSQIRAAGPNPACALVKANEIEAVVGAKVTSLINGPADLGNGVEVCTGTAGSVAIDIRFMPNTSGVSAKSTTRIVDAARQMGSQIESSTSGAVTCYLITPPEEMADVVPTGTLCTFNKGSRSAVIELSTKATASRVSLSKMHVLAQKLLWRL